MGKIAHELVAKVIRREGGLWFVLVMWVGWRFVVRLLGFVGEPNHTFPHNQGQLSLTWLTSAHSARHCSPSLTLSPLMSACGVAKILLHIFLSLLGLYIMSPWSHSELICSLTNSTVMVCKKCPYSRTWSSLLLNYRWKGAQQGPRRRTMTVSPVLWCGKGKSAEQC